MDLRFTADELAFRDELRTFFRDNLPGDIRERMRLGHAPTKDDTIAWQRILNRRSWAAYSWPKEYGGPGWTPVQRMIFLEENQLAPAPEVSSFNITMIGPVLIQFGTVEQKQRFLPRAASIDDWWCQGFSEPAPGPTSLRSKPPPSAMAMIMWSMARRSGPRRRITPIGASASCAPIRRPRSGRRGSRFC